MADDAPEVPEDDDLDAEVTDYIADQAIVYDSRTERLKVYASLIRATLPPIGRMAGIEGGHEIDVQSDVKTYREIALAAIFADIKRIAGDGIEIRAFEGDTR